MLRRPPLIVLAAAVLLISFFAWEWYLSPRARVERFLDRLAEAAEEKEAETLLSSLTEDFTSDRNVDRASLADLLERGFSRVDRLNVSLDDVRTEVEDGAARASFGLTVVAVRGQERYLLVGAPMQPEKLEVELVREEDGWKIRRVVRGSDL